jgi:hypothetical protein
MKPCTLTSSYSIRVNRPQLEVLVGDLRRLSWRMRGFGDDPQFWRDLSEEYDEDIFVACNECLWKLWVRLDKLKSKVQQSRYRLSLDYLEVGLCVTALRAMRRTRGRPWPGSMTDDPTAVKRRRSGLIRTLENCERRLQRRFKHNERNPELSERMLHQFSLYRKRIVHEFFKPDGSNGLAATKHSLFLTLVKLAEDGLREAGHEAPPNKELRKLVSRWLRDVRRYRVALGQRILYHDPSIAKSRLIPFVEKAWNKMNPTGSKRPDYVKIWSEARAIIDKLLPEVD